MGFDPDLDECTKIALRQMIDLIAARNGIDRYQAYALASLTADLRITQVVNGVKGVHCMIEKRYLNSLSPNFGMAYRAVGRHDTLIRRPAGLYGSLTDRTVSFRSCPLGVSQVMGSPARTPISAAPTGESTESLFLDTSASAG